MCIIILKPASQLSVSEKKKKWFSMKPVLVIKVRDYCPFKQSN